MDIVEKINAENAEKYGDVCDTCFMFATYCRCNSFVDVISNIENINKTLDYVFSTIDDMLYNNKLEEVEKLLTSINVKNTNPLILVGILTATDAYKSVLKNREQFYTDSHKVVNAFYEKNKANELLYDLK